MAARHRLVVDDEEDTHCTTRAQFLQANRRVLGDQMDLELYTHFPDQSRGHRGHPVAALPTRPAAQPSARPTLQLPPAPARRQPFPRGDIRKRAANDHDDD